MPAYLVLVWWYLWGFGYWGCCWASRSASSSWPGEWGWCCGRKLKPKLHRFCTFNRNGTPNTHPHTHVALSSWLTLVPENAVVADGASVSAACLHCCLWPDPWDTAISWVQASGTWNSVHVVEEAASESCDTCSLVSWPWSYEDLKDNDIQENKHKKIFFYYLKVNQGYRFVVNNQTQVTVDQFHPLDSKWKWNQVQVHTEHMCNQWKTSIFWVLSSWMWWANQ